MDCRIEHMVDEIVDDRKRVRDLIEKYEDLLYKYRIQEQALHECQDELGISNK